MESQVHTKVQQVRNRSRQSARHSPSTDFDILLLWKRKDTACICIVFFFHRSLVACVTTPQQKVFIYLRSHPIYTSCTGPFLLPDFNLALDSTASDLTASASKDQKIYILERIKREREKNNLLCQSKISNLHGSIQVK